MRLALLGGVAALCAATAIATAQAPATEQQTQTIIGCVMGDGSTQNPWTLSDVVIPPPAPANAGRGGAGRGGGGRGAGREGGAPAAAPAPTPPPPPPAPINVRVQGLDLTPWRGYRVQVEGVLSPAGAQRTIQAQSARSVYNYGCPQPKSTDK